MKEGFQQLQRLAISYGIQTAYRDVHGRQQRATADALFGVLAALGTPVDRMADVPQAFHQRQAELSERKVEPVIVAWDGVLGEIDFRLSAEHADTPVELVCAMEDGTSIQWNEKLSSRGGGQTDLELHTRGFHTLARRDKLPLGYHRLRCAAEGWSTEALLIAAPKKVYSRPGQRTRSWGVFTPAYALHSQKSWGGGNLTDLEAVWDWTSRLGGDVVATLPLLAAFLDEPCDFSPYTPASRLFWNEFFIDVTRVDELKQSPAARDMLSSASFQQELQWLREAPLVDYYRQAKLQRQLLEELSRYCFASQGARRDALSQFVQARPEVEDYAAFRATAERQRQVWTAWPQRLQDGPLSPSDYDQDALQYHIYVQWIVTQQMDHLRAATRNSSGGIYLDLPLGVHRGGYDTWRERASFALQASGGAPPDAFFTKGQNWGFAPLHPERIRQQGYQHLIAVLRHHFRHAGILRIDHVMQLHRLYWVPQGADARQGAYVRIPADELYAILCLESHRYECSIVGENLGTVPTYVNDALNRHDIRQMYVAQYEADARSTPPLPAVPRRCVASINTHDMANFAAYWDGQDLDLLYSLGLFDEQGIEQERDARRGDRQALVQLMHERKLLDDQQPVAQQVLDALYQWLAASPAEVMLINLEDLWLESEPQNVPGTAFERPNWRRKLKYGIEQIIASNEIAARLSHVARTRSTRVEKKS